jgi:peptide/nickel transport system permease protein
MTLTIVAAATQDQTKGKRRPWWRRNLSIVIGAALLGFMVALAIAAPWLGTVDPAALSPIRRLRMPSEQFWFGTDALGRDVYSRVIYGARASLFVGFAVAFVAVADGLLFGLLAGFNRWIDAILMRVMDGLMSIPSVLLAIALMALTRASLENVIAAIAIAEIPRVTRLVRGVVLSLREQPFVEAAIAVGTPTPAILRRHILPNTIAPLIVQATYIAASAIITEAILSFIGAGLPPSIPTWGNIIADGRSIFQVRPHLILIPAGFLSITVLAINLLGDGMRDALDPRLARQM